ncbi:uncharacterized protein LOC128240965 isoform X2 [Mya arenaria]|uniref:uncharacterized protein LOC128240887 n=1 Tax=Mya arenaria TaxID=6604 RepID=UPI0022E39A78|nr:uncharacterized protein LOC128240887 [Mya arenaria]XP_052813921.1 uncharacterized protein LOC128240965 isoform X2 [Mya arenaria]
MSKMFAKNIWLFLLILLFSLKDVEARYGGPPSSTSTSNGDCDSTCGMIHGIVWASILVVRVKKKGLICQEKKTSPETSSVSAIATRTSTLNGDYGVQAPAYTEKNFPTDQNISDATQDNGPFIVSYGKS